MSFSHFWLLDSQFARCAPLLPRDTRGVARVDVARVDDRRVISGIVHVLKSGGRRVDAPRSLYGPHKTLYNRFVRWSVKSVWAGIFRVLATVGAVPNIPLRVNRK